MDISEEDKEKYRKQMEESNKRSVKEALEVNCVNPQFVLDLKNKGFDLESIDSGIQVVITRGTGTDKEEYFTGFGDSVEEAVDNAMPIRDVRAEEIFNKEGE